MNVHAAGAGRETARLVELARLCLLNDETNLDFDLIARATAAVFDVPVSLVSIVGEHRLWYPTEIGRRLPVQPRFASFCSQAIERPDDVLVVPDTLLDPRFADAPVVVEDPHARFYAGAPLVSRRGFALGTLCVFDIVPRTLNAQERAVLARLAALTVSLIDDDDARESAVGGSLPVPITATAMFGCDAAGRVTSWNIAAQALLGYRADDVIGRAPLFIAEPDRARYVRDCVAVLQGTGDVSRLCRLTRADGTTVQATIATSCLNDAGGSVAGISSIEPFGQRGALRQRFAMFESVVVNAIDAVMIVESKRAPVPGQRIVFVNDALCRLTGYTAAELVGRTPDVLAGEATDPADRARVARALADGETLLAELLVYRKDGSALWAQSNISPVPGGDGTSAYALVVHRDVTERRAFEHYERERAVILEMAIRNEPLRTQLGRIVRLLEHVVPGSLGTVMLVEGERIVVGATDPLFPAEVAAAIDGMTIGPGAAICGSAAHERRPVFCRDLLTDERCAPWAELARSYDLRSCWSMPCLAADGGVLATFALYSHHAALPTAGQRATLDETARFVSLVIERHRDRQRLERMATLDALTGLPNRRTIEERLAADLAHARATRGSVAVGVLDLNRFKTVNDAFGHQVGDGVLSGVAARLSQALRPGERIGRASGDSFVVVVTGIAGEHEGVAAVNRLIELFRAPFAVSGFEIYVRPSVGLAFFEKTATSVADLLAAADVATTLAKQRGRALELAVPVTTAAAVKHLDLEHDLHHALERGEFAVFYQLVFDFRGRPVGAEALLRWKHPRFGIIEPGEFIPLAESNATIVPIGAWVIEEAVHAAQRWHARGRDVFITVNVSALQLDEPGLVDTVRRALASSGLAAPRLHLEVTESLIMRNPAASAATLLELRALGVKISVDDFGTGYSSLAYLQRFPIDTLKIDRGFVQGIGDARFTERSEHIVAAVVQFGRALGVATIAEGVEDTAQYAFVRTTGCDFVQGFLCARPVAETELPWSTVTPTA